MIKKSNWKKTGTKQLIKSWSNLSDEENHELEEFIAERFVGKEVTFQAFRKKTMVTGTIKRYNRVVKDNTGYFKIFDEEKNMYYKKCKVIFNGEH